MGADSTRPGGIRAVLCDDDGVLRTVMRRVATDAGLMVVAETPDTTAVIGLINEHDADVLVTDLAAEGGRGEDLLRYISDNGMDVTTVVFSSYVGDPAMLSRLGADHIVEKPDFARLEDVLRLVRDPQMSRSSLQHDDQDNRRRQREPRAEPPVPDYVSPSGLAPPTDRAELLASVEPGDAILAIDVFGIDAIAGQYGHLVATDLRLQAARLVTATKRSQDRLVATADGDILVLITDAFPEAGESVFQRLQTAWSRRDVMGSLVGGWVVRSENEAPTVTAQRALAALATATDVRPLIRH